MPRAIAVALALLLAAGCRREEASNVIARVGTSELTLEEALSHVDSSRHPIDDQLRLYVARWVNDELLYQEARKNGADKWPEVQRNIRDARRQLTADAYLRSTLERDTAGLDDRALQEFFNGHAAEFFVREQTVRLNLAILGTREPASAFAAALSRGTPWAAAIEQAHRDSALVSTVSGRFYSQQTLYPGELWKVAATLKANEVSFPVKIPAGYAVLQALAVLDAGTAAPFELARDEARQRMLVERRRRAFNELIGTLRARGDVEIVLDGVSDTTQYSRHE